MRSGKTGEGGPQRRALVEAIASGLSWTQAAEMSGVSRATVGRQMQSSAFRLEIARERAARTERVLGSLSAVALEAVESLRALLNSSNDSVRASACRTALEGLLKFNSAVMLEERLAAIEAQLAAGGVPLAPGPRGEQ